MKASHRHSPTRLLGDLRKEFGPHGVSFRSGRPQLSGAADLPVAALYRPSWGAVNLIGARAVADGRLHHDPHLRPRRRPGPLPRIRGCP